MKLTEKGAGKFYKFSRCIAVIFPRLTFLVYVIGKKRSMTMRKKAVMIIIVVLAIIPMILKGWIAFNQTEQAFNYSNESLNSGLNAYIIKGGCCYSIQSRYD